MKTLSLSGAGTRTVSYRIPRPVYDELIPSGVIAKLVNDAVKAAMARKGWVKARIGKRMFWLRREDIEAEKEVEE